jgi:hypothetical protein
LDTESDPSLLTGRMWAASYQAGCPFGHKLICLTMVVGQAIGGRQELAGVAEF